MRIVHAVRSGAFAGVERHVAVLATAQHEAGHEVVVVGGHPTTMPRSVPADVAWMPGTTLREVVANLIRTGRSSVVHAHMTAAEAAALVGTHPRSPVVAARHFAAPRGQSPAGRAISPAIRARIAAQIAVSDYVARAIDGPSDVVYPGVASSPLREPGHAKPVVLAVQRLEAEKGVDVVLRAFAGSRAAAHGYQLLVVGQGSLDGDLRALARELGVDERVEFLGQRDDVPALMAEASVFVSGCAIEGLGLSVLEAMAVGLPVVTTAAGGHLETVGSVDDSYLFPPGDSVAAADRMNSLLNDDVARDDYGRALQEAQRLRFTPERQQEGTLAVYERVCR